jgi:poly-gamma-glutamate capsule biosynthesis protein CapA/YwtB (metallophosphatase superfamily)
VPSTTSSVRLGRRLGRIVLLVCLTWLFQPGRTSSVTLALLGDVMLGRGIAAAGTSPTEVMGALAPDLASADLVLANLESPLTDAPAKTSSDYVLCAPPAQVQVLTAAGLDLLSVANNHSLDCGESGLDDTRATLSAAGIQAIGPEPSVVYREVRSSRLAFIALDDVTRPLSLASAIHAIGEARASGAFVVVSIHWGAEYQTAPNARQRAIADALTQAGAGLVWGHHPHVLQPVETADCGLSRGCMVLYSLGNAVFDQVGLADTRRSAAVLVRVDDRGVIEARAVPFTIDVRRGMLVTSSPDDASAVMRQLGPEVQVSQ